MMSPSRPLREEVIEAGARAWMAYEGDDWDAMGPKPQQAIIEATEVIVDAFLDALETKADEWWHEAFEPEYRHGKVTDNLIAVLREGDE